MNSLNSINRLTGKQVNKLTVAHIFSGDLWAGAEVMVFNLYFRYYDKKIHTNYT